VSRPDTLENLVEGTEAPLAGWFAEPLSAARARSSLDGLGRRRLGLGTGPGRTFGVHLAEMICHYWAGSDIEADYRNLSALYRGERDQAALELVSGQLLIARRLRGAWRHLERGFALAARLLDAEDYFVVLGRHELLRQLPLFAEPSAPAGLDALLCEARVIARLRGTAPRRSHHRTSHRDTID
jgi:hypothetical protein